MKKNIIRKSFTKKEKFVFNIPDLLKIQIESYDLFLQKKELPLKRKNIGLQSVFNTFFPIFSKNNIISLNFLCYKLLEPIYNVKECKKRGLSFSSVLKVVFILVAHNKKKYKKKIIKNIKQEIFMGEIPLMTDVGTFIINGTERTVVSQLYKSPGVFFEYNKNKIIPSEKKIYIARVIPYKGSWLEFEFNSKDILYFRIDKSAKIPVTVLLKAMNMTSEEILSSFFLFDKIFLKGNFAKINIPYSYFIGKRLKYDLYSKDGKLLLKKNNLATLESLKCKNKNDFCNFLIDKKYLIGFVLAENILNNITGEELAFINQVITIDLLFLLEREKIKFLKVVCIGNINYSNYVSKILNVDKTSDFNSARLLIYKNMRFNELPSQEIANIFFENLFFNKERYNLSLVGRLKINKRLGFKDSYGTSILSKKDIIYIIKTLIDLKNNIGKIDDMEHLGNRRVRSVGELVENQLRFGLIKYEKMLRERLNLVKQDNLMSFDFVNFKIISNILRDFFGTSQLSQFLDQTNPLSEITHKRRISSLGPGGLTRERAGFEVRDIHYTHYGRICPIETPEGPNIGLINSLALYAYLNKHGFLVTPYFEVINGKITFKVKYLSAIDEMLYFIAQTNSNISKSGLFLDSLVSARNFGENVLVSSKNVNYVDVSPAQLVSIATSLIPFLEHDDANRALMGANMQRQAVPCIKPESPLIGTGNESVIILNSGKIIKSLRGGKVIFVDSKKIIISVNSFEITSEIESGLDIYNLIKYKRTNQDTILNQKAIVDVGDLVKKNDIIADCSSSKMGELSLGQNILVAFMSWNGYNFEDSIIISERIVAEDRYTSIHIEELTVVARETKLGFEEITRDVIDLSSEQLSRLDESGIVKIGSKVISGDVLVGKITPRGEVQLTPEEKLLHIVFSKKSSDVKDTSLRVPLQMKGVVVDVQVFTKEGFVKDKRSLIILENKLNNYKLKLEEEMFFTEINFLKKLKNRLIGNYIISAPNLKNGDIITKEYLYNLKKEEIFKIILKSKKLQKFLIYTKGMILVKEVFFKNKYFKKIKELQKNDILPVGINKMVKVYVAIKKKLQPGDKMSGRHGNKGVLSRILPVEDMPHMADGTVIDIILNPLGIPSRMNVGQVLEVHLGLASKGLGLLLQKMIDSNLKCSKIRKFLKKIYNFSGKKENFDNFSDKEIFDLVKNIVNGVPFSTPVFDGATEKDINYLLNLAFPDNISKELKMNEKKNQVILYDGITGEPFKQFITIGYIYFLKLNHLVVDKMHSRSTGPYSLITQQPLGGKAQFGGQRFGEMEVWALESYGASYSLQEMLTVKSDDIKGRIKIYKNLIKGTQEMTAGIPESFNVLIKEIRSLCIDIELKYK